MQFRFGWNRIFLAAALLLGNAVSAFWAAAADDAAQAQAAGYDFTVVAATKDASHPHYGEGSTIGFVVDGVPGRTLILIRGKTYTFSVNTGAMHDFYLSTDPKGWGAATLAAGVKGNFTYKGTVTFKPTAETPDLVYYACRNHKYMGGTIHIVNPGEENKIKLAEPAAAAAVHKDHPVLDKDEVKQRLNFVDMYISQSDAAKRIAASDDEAAKAKYKEAQDRLASAKSAFDSDNLQEAKTKFDEAAALMKEAAQHVPSQSALDRAKARNAELLQSVTTLEASYQQNRQALASEGGAKDLAKLDSDKIHKMLDSAKALSEAGNYDEANKILADALDEVSIALNKILANKTVSYEMKFTSPAQEYEYELARFSSYEELIPQALENFQPPQETLALTESYINKGKEKRERARADAQQKNFAAALENIKEGTEQLKTALHLLGVD